MFLEINLQNAKKSARQRRHTKWKSWNMQMTAGEHFHFVKENGFYFWVFGFVNTLRGISLKGSIEYKIS